MGQRRVKWKDVERYCNSHDGFAIEEGRGGERVVVGPPGPDQRGKQAVRIGHTSCRNKGTEVKRCYLSALKRAFGIGIDDLLDK